MSLTAAAVEELPKDARVRDALHQSAEPAIEVSVVMPCLNEADTVAVCVEKAWRALRESGIDGEVIVADNGSTDDSRALALACGARVVEAPARGYGNALMAGIASARGHFVVMGDADDTYDFLEIPRFVEELRRGYDVVQGCRLPSGGGRIMPGAMPFLHRWWGNPMFSMLARRWFLAPIHDVNCGLRAFRKAHYDELDQRCTGMEFAIEMIVKSSLSGAKIGEVPITLYPGGRRSHAPHLRTFRDGWRTLRSFLLYCPRWLFLFPGVVLIVLGLLAYAVGMPGLTIHGIEFDVHTLLYGSLAILCGYQSVMFAMFTTTFAVLEGLRPPPPRYESFHRVITLERGLVLGLVLTAIGLAFLTMTFGVWVEKSFGPLDYRITLRRAIPGVTLVALGIQTVLSSFFVNVLSMTKRT